MVVMQLFVFWTKFFLGLSFTAVNLVTCQSFFAVKQIDIFNYLEQK